MFKSEVYVRRREVLRQKVGSGLALFTGNVESPINYADNAYHFRQDSDFLYFFGLDFPGFAALLDFDTGEETIFGDDFSIDDIVWMGKQPTVASLAMKCGISRSMPLSKLVDTVYEAKSRGREIHFLPPYRGETKLFLGMLLKENPCSMESKASARLVKAVVSLRSIKEDVEIEEMEKAVAIAYDMHTTAMKMCKPGVKEQEIFGVMEGIACAQGAGTSFPTILSMNGQTLHNHYHGNFLETGRLMVADAGAESDMHYASDITRTTPVGGKFNTVQKEVYEVVLKANMEAIRNTRPGISNRDTHILAGKVIASGLKDLGIMKGDVDEAVAEGAHSLFMPHGIGHLLGLDVHDMEGLGEKNVGYSEDVQRSEQFGLSFLRFALEYRPGHVFTIEPGCYFIPDLIDQWKADRKHVDFINYEKLKDFMCVGGIRIEDNVLITETGHKVLGKPIPKSVAEIEDLCR